MFVQARSYSAGLYADLSTELHSILNVGMVDLIFKEDVLVLPMNAARLLSVIFVCYDPFLAD